MAGKKVEEKLYIIQHDGINLSAVGIKREDIKVGKTVKLDPTIGDKYCTRGFLQDADTVVESEGPDARLVRENEKLKEENEKLKTQIADLKK